jgi:opacity protein-like surface antigen
VTAQLAAVLTAVLAVAIGAAPASAQPPAEAPSLRRNHVTLAGGLTWAGGYSIGDATAELRSNGLGSSPPPFTYFRAESSVDTTIGGEFRIGFGLSRDLSVEFGVGYSTPGIRTELSQDAEAAAVTLDAEQLAQYVVDVGATWQLPRPVIGGRIRPFVTGGAGYLRQLYDERTLVESGSVYYAGGGVRVWLRGGDGQQRSLGVRTDVRATWRRDGVEFEDQTRWWPSVTAMIFWEP